MKSFLIGGTIIDDKSQAWATEDTTPAQVRSFLSHLEKDEPFELQISSPGGSVTAGIAIANLIREAEKDGHACTAHVIGIAASMASVIACAPSSVKIDASAFMMIHNPWTVAQGDADDLRKSADVLDMMKKAIMSFYRSKFEKTEDEIVALMDAETWFTGSQAADFGFKAEVIASEGELKAAACARQLPSFANIPAAAEHLFVIGRHQPPAVDPATIAAQEPAQPSFEDRLAAAMKSRDTEINDLKRQLAECERKAVDLAAGLEKDFQDKLAARDKELTEAKAEVTRLAADCEKTKRELQETASALDASKSALATLNANVNTPSPAPATRTVNARAYMAALPVGQRNAFYLAHRDEVDGNKTINL